MPKQKYVRKVLGEKPIYLLSLVLAIISSLGILFHLSGKYYQGSPVKTRENAIKTNTIVLERIKEVRDTVTVIRRYSRAQLKKAKNENIRIILITDSVVDGEFQRAITEVDSLARQGYFTDLEY
jgi:hypothetical protein